MAEIGGSQDENELRRLRSEKEAGEFWRIVDLPWLENVLPVWVVLIVAIVWGLCGFALGTMIGT